MTIMIDIISDVVCPWCYIGKRRLELAVHRVADRHEVAVAWRPFQLNPDLPPEGMERSAYLAAKFGSLERARAMHGQLAELGQEVGIEFAFDRIRRTPNTVDAHRLIRLAQDNGAQERMVEALFRGYFEEGEDLGDRAALARLAWDADLDPDQVLEFLESEDGFDVVKAEDSVARRMGVDGVPCYLFNRQVVIFGAQPPDILEAAMDQAAGLGDDAAEDGPLTGPSVS